jgi:REP element-mobilizing transposase RayT
MAQTLTRILVHVIFSTKDRACLIKPAVEPDLHAYMGGICRGNGSPLLCVDGVEDHVHLLVSLSKTLALSDLIMQVKRDSSSWVKERFAAFSSFGWQDGYAAFSIGKSQVERVRAYIASQKEHHGRVSFQDELRRFLEAFGVEYDERYIWS